MTTSAPASRERQAAALRILCRIALRQMANEDPPREQVSGQGEVIPRQIPGHRPAMHGRAGSVSTRPGPGARASQAILAEIGGGQL